MLQIFALLILTIALIWIVMSAPIGIRTISRQGSAPVSAAKLWSALHPFGTNYDWNGAVTEVIRTGDSTGRMITSHTGRDLLPIEREFELSEEVPEKSYTLRFTDDTSLAQSFWEHHRMTVEVFAEGEGRAGFRLAETDRYKGVAFLLFRFFALRRTAIKLRRWAQTGEYSPGGIFEHPVTQFGMAALSAVLLWPFFGLDAHGLFLSVTLTAVVALHELGHMAAFRLMGHSRARMIFIPLLGGIALGGRPYDRQFEIGFSALMGAGMTVFPIAFALMAIDVSNEFVSDAFTREAAIVVLIAALFNLGNLMPVWKFDGGQVLRQVLRSGPELAAGSFAMLSVMMATGLAVGLSLKVMLACGAVILLLSLITGSTGVKPKRALSPMDGVERVALSLGLLATASVHALAIVWCARIFFHG